MEKIKSNLPAGLLLSYLIKILVISPSLQDAYIIIGLIGLTAFFRKIHEDDTINHYKAEVKKMEAKQLELETGLKEIQLALGSTKLLNSIKTFPGANVR